MNRKVCSANPDFLQSKGVKLAKNKREKIHGDKVTFKAEEDKHGHYVVVTIISKKYHLELYVYLIKQESADDIIRVLQWIKKSVNSQMYG